jgi:hypothetical protein
MATNCSIAGSVAHGVVCSLNEPIGSHGSRSHCRTVFASPPRGHYLARAVSFWYVLERVPIRADLLLLLWGDEIDDAENM